MASRYFAPEPIDIERLDSQRFAVTYKDRRYEVDAQALEGGLLSLLVDGRSHLALVEETRVQIDGALQRFSLVDERTQRVNRAAGGSGTQGKQIVRTPMPGKIVKVWVSPGQEVQEGQGLVVVEAMKMENELRSPKTGRVEELWAVEGTTVEGNTPLVSIGDLGG